ncbi:hypothetical protein Acr_28g0000730 [Actinidia rufa]|uniref:Uncharacterized protein n=1 Tax=Actinidia rufa TaxID=165716 RepID=A0A7J0H8L5_9ERIC|nr:hypothetical protein Acr_28g0000730 [Actinidia rufa]
MSGPTGEAAAEAASSSFRYSAGMEEAGRWAPMAPAAVGMDLAETVAEGEIGRAGVVAGGAHCACHLVSQHRRYGQSRRRDIEARSEDEREE